MKEMKNSPIYKRTWFVISMLIIAIPAIIIQIIVLIADPTIVIPELSLIILLYIIIKILKEKKRKKQEELQKDRELIRKGYEKINKDFYINKKEEKLNILNKTYEYDQILDCELIENGMSIPNTTGNVDICTELVINITIKDIDNPRILLNCIDKMQIDKDSKEYKETIHNTQNIVAILKIIVNQNNEKYMEKGTITKIEHNYITQENASVQIERLSQLYQDEILTEYEFEMKKKELLEKIK